MSSEFHRIAVTVENETNNHVVRITGVDDTFTADVTAVDWIRGRSDVGVVISTQDDTSADYTLFGIALDEQSVSAGGLLVRCPSQGPTLVTGTTYYVHMYS